MRATADLLLRGLTSAGMYTDSIIASFLNFMSSFIAGCISTSGYTIWNDVHVEIAVARRKARVSEMVQSQVKTLHTCRHRQRVSPQA